MQNVRVKTKAQLSDFISVLTDYHANGAYKKLKENVELLDKPDYAVMIRTTNFEKQDLTDDLKYISEDAYNFLKKSKVKPGDILMNKIANPGSVYLMPDLKKPVSLAMNLFLIRVNQEEINQTYVYYWLKKNEAYVKSFANGAATQTITKQAVKELEIDVIPRESQDRIVEILDAYQNLIENNNRRIAILEEMAQSLYREWFVKFRFPGHENTKFIDSPLGKIPDGWDIVTLGDEIDIRKGKNITKKTIVEGAVPVVAGGLTPAYYHNQANTHHPVITVSASGANAGFVNLYEEDIWASDCSYIDTDVTPYVYYFYSLFKDRQVEMTRLQRGSAQPHVYPKDLMRLDVLRVPKELLEKFSMEIVPTFGMIKNLSLRNNRLRQSRDLLLPKLISGSINLEKK